jgi:tRNA modification GTPase
MINDTIVAISTALGEGAISIVRLSGTESIAIVNKLFKGKDLCHVESHTINYGHIIHPVDLNVVDEVLVSVMRSPRTYTSEDVVEINCHGGIYVTQKILELILTEGVRLAEPGEFTKRAFLNNRLDLAQAESVMDLIRAKTEESLQVAIGGIDGRVSKLIKELREKVLFVIANIEVNIDYPEYDDVIEMSNDLLKPKIEEVINEINRILDVARTGKIIREGIKTAIIGRPNVGKSSLLNKLMREERAIVTEIAGTTRDAIEGYVNIGGLTLNLVDTAGIRETDDLIEAIGINRSKKALEEAELVLLVLNNNDELTDSDRELIHLTDQKQRLILVNKTDLPSKMNRNSIPPFIETSMLDENSIELIETNIKQLFNLGELKSKDLTYVSNSRHIAKLNLAKKALEDGLESIAANVPIDMTEIDIKEAWRNLGEILGEEVGDSLLNELFSKFCLGK